MPTPIVESIALDVVSTLQGITTGNGYEYTLTVERYNRLTGGVIADKKVIVKQGSPFRVGAKGDSQGMIWWYQPFEAHVWILEPDTSSTPIDEIINKIRSDIEKRLMVDYTRGGYAQDTRIEDHEIFRSETGDLAGIAVRFTVQYPVDHDDPYWQT